MSQQPDLAVPSLAVGDKVVLTDPHSFLNGYAGEVTAVGPLIVTVDLRVATAYTSRSLLTPLTRQRCCPGERVRIHTGPDTGQTGIVANHRRRSGETFVRRGLHTAAAWYADTDLTRLDLDPSDLNTTAPRDLRPGTCAPGPQNTPDPPSWRTMTMSRYEVTNHDRAAWARVALDAFGNQTGQRDYNYADPDCLAEIAGDLIADLLHLAHFAGMTPDELIAPGRGHFDDELGEDAADHCGAQPTTGVSA